MASTTKFKLHGPLDNWSTREKLALACSVLRSGDQNWVSVSRSIKPFGESSRPQEWFSQKNCALQYTDLLEKVETPKRKRGDRGEIETPQLQIIRQLAVDRAEELKKEVVECQQRYKKLKRDLEYIKSGQWDDQLPEMWEQMQKEKAEKDATLLKTKATEPADQDEDTSHSVEPDIISEDSNQDTIPDPIDVTQIKTEAEDSSVPVSKPLTLDLKDIQTANQSKDTPPTSPLPVLSTLLQSEKSSYEHLQKLKQKAEAKEQTATKTLTPPIKSESTTVAGDVTDKAGNTSTGRTPSQSTENIEIDIKEEVIEVDQGEEIKVEDTKKETSTTDDKLSEETKEKDTFLPEKTSVEDEKVDSQNSEDHCNSTFISVDDEVSISIPAEQDPLSPASSESSKMSEDRFLNTSQSRRGGRRGSGRRYSARNRKSVTDEDKKEDMTTQLSDAETTDDDGQESDDTAIGSTSMVNTSVTATFSESIPNSPLSHCSDTEDDKAHKNWKKSIMLVWRMAANHKYANVFLHPVTNEIAPGYQSIVHRRMDLTTIKKNIEAGILRTTQEFQRDMMLMFTNAIMYNNCNHNVHKMAVEMYDDVMTHIEQYVSTQLMLQSSESKSLRPSRRTESSDKSDKEDDSKRRRTFSESLQEGGKAKKRKTRGDDT